MTRTSWNKGQEYITVDGYHVTTSGQVWSLRKKCCRLLNGWLDREGYRYYDIKGKCVAGHRLVAEKYLPNPNNLPIVDHIDRNRQNNRLENLRWVTIPTNNANRIFGGTLKQAIEFVISHGYNVTKPC